MASIIGRALTGAGIGIFCWFFMGVFVGVSGLSAYAAGGPSATDPSSNRIVLKVTSVRDAKGAVKCAMWGSPDGFPKNRDKAIGVAAPIRNGEAKCVFNNMAPGTYAVAVLHDDDNNGHMEYNFLGLPKKGYGFSNDASTSLGAPSFRDASFKYAGGVLRVTLKMRYWASK